jgi:hypothetical protein
MDNDGFKDIFVTNGINHDLTNLDFVDFFANQIIQKMALTGKKQSIDTIINKMPSTPIPNYAYKNNHDITFTNEAEKWGLDQPGFSNGSAYADLDNDGDLDLVINNVNMQAFIYRNNSDKLSANNYIKLKLDGTGKNKFAIGSVVKLYYNNNVVIQELIPSRGFQSSMDYIMTIGLGTAIKIDSLRVIWPDDKTQKLINVGANQFLNLKQIEATETYKFETKTITPFLSEFSSRELLAHKENTYVDFDYEGLIYQMLSQEGPTLSVADINGNGNEDVFIGGAKDQPGIIYLNTGDANLKKSNQIVLEEDAGFEDTASAFFDADGDGDMDLMVGSGGNQVGEGKTYKARLYLNDGKGKLVKSEINLASTYKNISVIVPYDFDNDGDQDVFIGSRSVVGTYGVNPDHLFLENNGDGSFTNATERVAYDLKNAGMITNAIWADIDGDDIKDLITVSDWGSPIIFKNSGRRLSKLTTNLESLTGWWNVVEVADLDNDGDNDLIMGNKGSNTSYKTSEANPMKMWVNDFDNNGTLEQIVTRNFDGKDFPINMKKDLTTQMSSLKKQNLKASDYAKRSIEELFPSELLNNSILKIASVPETIIAVNMGKGKFEIQKLPYRVQLSSVSGITSMDINGDGNLDLILGGNNFEFKPQFSRMDASYGNVLFGDGKLNFTWQNYDQSGFNIKNEIKHLKTFRDKNGKTFIIAAINNEKPKIFRINEK